MTLLVPAQQVTRPERPSPAVRWGIFVRRHYAIYITNRRYNPRVTSAPDLLSQLNPNQAQAADHFTGPALVIGIVAGIVCYYAATGVKHMLGYDDSLDAFGVHGVGGIVGALLTGVFAYGPLSATTDKPEGVFIAGAELFKAQCIAVGATVIYSAVATFVILMVVKAVMGLRVSTEEEREGLDIVLHGEQLG